MKKHYCLVVALFLFSAVNAQIIHFSDVNFKNALLSSSPSVWNCQDSNGVNITVDSNTDGQIQVSEALAVYRINLYGLGISSLSGIENFANLRNLFCSNNQLTTLDVSMFENLTSLACQNNLLTSLHIGHLPSLTILSCGNNLLTTLDVSGASLTEGLNCRSNHLQTLFIKNGTTPQYSFVIEDNPELQYICVDESEIDFVQLHVSSHGYNCVVNSYCSFNPGGEFYLFQATAKADMDNNGCDLNDEPFPFFRVNVSNGSVTDAVYSDANGNIDIPLQANTYALTPNLENPEYFNVTPSSITINFPSQNTPFLQPFCVTPNGHHTDVEVVIVPVTMARPGFDSTCKIIYRNKGNVVSSGNIILEFSDSRMDFVSAVPLVSNEQFNYLSWAYQNLAPFETREIVYTMNLNSPMESPAVNAGDLLGYSAVIAPLESDSYILDNQFSFKQTVVNSFDPNDKICLEGATITPEMVGKEVHYVIRFENTGTANAENIVVKDLIDVTKFDINSLVPIDGSHPFVTKISNGNKVEFIFENLQLPFDDMNNDGYVAFKIKTKPTLVIGDTFSNTASIYFDYNFPIVTEPAVTTVTALAKSDFQFEQYVVLHPNPANSVLNITAKGNIKISSASIYNTLGQLLLVIPNTDATNSIDVSSLQTGNYFIKIQSDKGASTSQFLKK